MQEAVGVRAPDLERLRQLVHDNVARNFPSAAAFFANKLATLSDSPADLLLLAKVRVCALCALLAHGTAKNVR